MFYCDPCGSERDWPAKDLLIPTSRGRCEICGKVAECNDVPSSWLSVSPPAAPAAPPAVEATRCPTCESPEPRLHPATQAEGEVVQICHDSFHAGTPWPQTEDPSERYEENSRRWHANHEEI